MRRLHHEERLGDPDEGVQTEDAAGAGAAGEERAARVRKLTFSKPLL